MVAPVPKPIESGPPEVPQTLHSQPNGVVGAGLPPRLIRMRRP